MKHFLMRTFMVVFIVLLVWIIIAPSCMTMRTPDNKMKEEFSKQGVQLTTATQQVAGHAIHYAVTGRDTLPTIIFIHGTPGSWDAFAGYLKDSVLLQHYRLISIDRPGFGYSDFGKAWHLQQQSGMMSPVLQTFKNEKPIFLVGHSLGGPMVVKLAADNPSLFSAVVIISGSIDPAEEKPEKWRPWLFNTPLNLLVPGALRQSNKEIWYFKKDLVGLKNDFNKIWCPVVFIHGQKDTWVPPGNVAYGKRMLVNAAGISELFFPDGNHFIPWTKFAEIKETLMNLLEVDKAMNH
jgi:pimeloyl-ACP methyl ester carboxylesterase